MTSFLQDVRYGVRALGRSPGFTAVAIATLALGIGANTAIFSVVRGVLLRPLPYPDPGALVLAQTVQKEPRQPWGTAPPDFYSLRERNRAFDGLASFYFRSENLTGEKEPERVPAMIVSSNFFAVLGRGPALGRGFTKTDEHWGSHLVVILTDGLWRRRFAGDPHVIGRTIRLNSVGYLVAGVLPPGFWFGRSRSQLFLPMAFAPGDNLNTHNNYFLTMVGRLKTGVTRERALADLNAIMGEIEREHPENKGLGADVTALQAALVQDVRAPILVLMGAVGFVLLIACANLANLLLARGVGRRREIAIRAALGASHERLVRQFLTEGVLLASLGGSTGLLLASWSMGAVRLLGPGVLPRGDQIRLDPMVLAFALGVTVFTGLLFELAPALHGARADLNDALSQRAGPTGGARGRRFLRGALVVAEIALSLVLLIGAGLMLKSVHRLLRVERGFDPSNLLTAEISLSRLKYIDERLAREFSPEAYARATQFYDSVIQRLRTLPGVQAVGATSGLPLGGENWGKVVTFYDRPLPSNARDLPPIQYRVVGGDYFQAAGIRLLRGRAFTEQDTLHAPLVAIVNRELVRRYWNARDPIGKVLSVNPPRDLVPTGTLPPNYTPEKYTIVGVAEDARYGGLDTAPSPLVYVPYAQGAEGATDMFLVVRTQGDPLALVAPIRARISDVDRDQPIANVATMGSRVDESVFRPLLITLVLGSFAALATLLAAIGIYGVMWSSVQQRTTEIGIRMALGADSARVVAGVLADGLRLTFAGIGIGLAAALAVSRTISSLLFEVHPTDLATYACVALALATAALAACYLPARRAAGVDPMRALRSE